MARGGVTYFDIANAAETIKDNGKNPTVDRVLNHLGTGSKSTIGPHLKAWKEKHLEHSRVSDLPIDLLKAVRELHQRLQSEADSKVENAEQRMTTQKIVHSEKIEKLRNGIKSLTKTVNELQQNKDNLSEDNKKLNKDLDKANQNKIKLVSKNESDAQLILELIKSKNEINHQLKLAHEQQEHFQLKVAEERSIERTESQAIRTQFKTQIADLTQQILAANERDSHSRKESNEQSKKIQKLSDSFHALECDMVKKDATISTLEEKLEQNIQKIQATLESNKDLNKLHLQQSIQISALTSENTILKDYLKVARKDIESIQNRYESKAEAYQEICQEKNSLESQLKKLQDSL